MTIETDLPKLATLESAGHRVFPISQCEDSTINCPVNGLREALVREERLLRQKDELIQQLELQSRESDHRLLNNMQIVSSLLSLQSRACTSAETASQLAIAANRVATIERIHRRLHSLDGIPTVAFKQYLEDFCHDFSTMLVSREGPERTIIVGGAEIDLPAAISIPLGFIANELITNAAKYGKGQILVELERGPEKGCALSVLNDGSALPEEFDPAASEGLGMKIITSFVKQINGELRFGRGDGNQGARFTVLFPYCAQVECVPPITRHVS